GPPCSAAGTRSPAPACPYPHRRGAADSSSTRRHPPAGRSSPFPRTAPACAAPAPVPGAACVRGERAVPPSSRPHVRFGTVSRRSPGLDRPWIAPMTGATTVPGRAGDGGHAGAIPHGRLSVRRVLRRDAVDGAAEQPDLAAGSGRGARLSGPGGRPCGPLLRPRRRLRALRLRSGRGGHGRAQYPPGGRGGHRWAGGGPGPCRRSARVLVIEGAGQDPGPERAPPRRRVRRPVLRLVEAPGRTGESIVASQILLGDIGQEGRD